MFAVNVNSTKLGDKTMQIKSLGTLKTSFVNDLIHDHNDNDDYRGTGVRKIEELS